MVVNILNLVASGYKKAVCLVKTTNFFFSGGGRAYSQFYAPATGYLPLSIHERERMRIHPAHDLWRDSPMLPSCDPTPFELQHTHTHPHQNQHQIEPFMQTPSDLQPTDSYPQVLPPLSYI